MKNFLSIPQNIVYKSEIVIEKSRFLGFAYYVDKEPEDILAQLKKQYADSTHICFAYRLQNTSKCSDDGEPSGTAGRPILQVLEKQNLYNILLVVVRYFGGIKLGAGGLLRAYTNTATQCLENEKVLYEQSTIYEITLEYNEYETFQNTIKNRKIVVLDTQYLEKIKVRFVASDTEAKIPNSTTMQSTMYYYAE